MFLMSIAIRQKIETEDTETRSAMTGGTNRKAQARRAEGRYSLPLTHRPSLYPRIPLSIPAIRTIMSQKSSLILDFLAYEKAASLRSHERESQQYFCGL